MGKKSKAKKDKLENYLFKAIEQQEQEIKFANSKFYDNNGLVEFSFSSEQEPLAPLNKGRQVYGHIDSHATFLLGNMVVKIVPMDVGKPEYLFIRDGDTLDTTIFLGGEYGSGIMLITDERGDDYFLRLSEFHLISIEAESNSPEKVALMTSYIWLAPKVYMNVFRASDYYSIINLLLSDWIQEEWKRAKDAANESSNKEIGGEINEQR